jgi:anti-sigma B factor antagonist
MTEVRPRRGGFSNGSDAIGGLEAFMFELAISTDRDRTLISPAGELDLATAPVLERRIAELIQAGRQRLVVDLRAVTFIDSTGIHALVNAHQSARRAGRTLSIIPGGPAIRRTFDLVGVTALFELEPGDSLGAA